jgi:protein-tyrosine kinase
VSKFLKALELAEQERIIRRTLTPSGRAREQSPASHETISSRPSPAASEAVPSQAPQSFFRVPPRRAVSAPAEHAFEIEEHLVSLLDPTSFEAEQYRTLRHLTEQLHKSTALSVIAISSPGAADGKTTTAINLAGALAQAPDARVLLIDGDLRGGTLAARLGLDNRPGLVDAILDANLPLEVVARPRPPLNLSVLPAGRLPSAPYEVLKSPRVGELFAEARRRYDYIVLDTPPLVSFPDCRVIGRWVDGFLIVVTAHRTGRKLLEEALHITEPAKIVGLVFNEDDRHLSRTSYPVGRYSDQTGDGSAHRIFWSRSSTRRGQTASDD